MIWTNLVTYIQDYCKRKLQRHPPCKSNLSSDHNSRVFLYLVPIAQWGTNWKNLESSKTTTPPFTWMSPLRVTSKLYCLTEFKESSGGAFTIRLLLPSLYHLWGGVGWGRPPQFDHNIPFLSQVHNINTNLYMRQFNQTIVSYSYQQIKILEFYPTPFWDQFLPSIYRGLKNLSRNLTTPCIECWAHSTYFMLKAFNRINSYS